MKQEQYEIPSGGTAEEPQENYERYLNPNDIMLPRGYTAEVFAYGLETPISIVFTENGDLLIGDSGIRSGSGKVIRLSRNGYQTIADGFVPPLTGINYMDGEIYVSHRGKITVIHPDGSTEDILSGLPSFGDHHNNKVVFGPDGKMYFGQGTATNSGVVGLDNQWLKLNPFFHDYPGSDITLAGYNYPTQNILAGADEVVYTGAFSPFGIPTTDRDEVVNGIVKASGSILRANPDGTELEQIAWGLRNPFRLEFDQYNRLFAANHGADVRGSRPIANCLDEFQLIVPGAWYGWPDFSGGKPVTLPEFQPQDGPKPVFLLSNHPAVTQPFTVFEPHSAVMGFDFNYSPNFGPIGDVFIAEYGSEAPETTGGQPLPGVGHRVSRINMQTGEVTPFAMNRSGVAASESGEGGFDRPIDVVFGPDGAMYVADFGVNLPGEPDEFYHNTGVIWRITRTM